MHKTQGVVSNRKRERENEWLSREKEVDHREKGKQTHKI